MDSRSLRTDGTDQYLISPQNAYNIYGTMVYRLAFARTASREDADDVTQEVFLRLLKKKPRFASEEHLRAWLVTVTLNCTRKLFGSAYRRRSTELSDDIPAPEREENGVLDAVMSLPSKYRTVIHLHYFEGYSIEEISRLTSVGVNTVKTRLMRGRTRLREMLGDEDDV